MKNALATTRLTPRHRPARRAFSLVEVLVAIGILGLGLIMVASIFPVGADWTRQNIDESIAAQLARNAAALIQSKYTATDLTSATGLQSPYTMVQAIPGLTQSASGTDMPKLTIYERAFQYGSSSSVMTDPRNAQYFWTALIRLTPGTISFDHITAANCPTYRQFDLYILVFKKGDLKQQFTTAATALLPMDSAAAIPTYTWASTTCSFGHTRVRSTDSPTTLDETFVPLVLVTSKFNDVPMGSQAIGTISGTVFRTIPSSPYTNLGVTMTDGNTPPTSFLEPVAFVPPADGTTRSPLIYIYQTKVSF